MQEQNNKGLKVTTIWLMIAVALLFDVMQILLSYLLLGWLMIPVFYMTFWLWFNLNGVKFLTIKKAPSHAIGAILEMASAGIIPAFTFVVARVALTAKIKEVESKVVDLSDYRKKKDSNDRDSGENQRAA